MFSGVRVINLKEKVSENSVRPQASSHETSSYSNPTHRTSLGTRISSTHHDIPHPIAASSNSRRQLINNESASRINGFLSPGFRQSASNLFASVVRIGSTVFSSGLEAVQNIFSEESIDDTPPREDVLKFNGFTVRTYGNALTLDSVHVNGGGEKKMSVKVKISFGKEASLKFAYPILGDNKWTLRFPKLDSFIEIEVPLGVNSDIVTWEQSEDEVGQLIIDI